MKRILLIISLFIAASVGSFFPVHAAPDDDLEAVNKQKEKARIMDDMNTFLIDSYKLKIDKIIQELMENVKRVAKDDPKLQKRIMERIIEEVEAKEELLNSKSVSPNRKKVLSAIFEYIKTSIEQKIKEASGENKN